MKHLITIKKLHSIILPQTDGEESNKMLAATFNAEMARLGFVMSKNLFEFVSSSSKEEIHTFYAEVIEILKVIKGDNVRYVPMYPGFPEQVMEMDDVELYVNALIHYWSDGKWLPEYKDIVRKYGYENTKLITLNICTEEDFMGVFPMLLSSNSSISEEDRNIVSWFMKQYGFNNLTFPKIIPFKETLCIIASEVAKSYNSINNLVTNVTDVLRVMTYLSGGDVSLTTNTKFKSQPKYIRRILLLALQSVMEKKKSYIFDDYVRHGNKWIRAFHNLHVGSYAKRYPLVAEAADLLRSKDKKIETFSGKVENALLNKDVEKAAKLLINQPGDFARRLDHLVRLSDKSKIDFIIEKWTKAAKKVSTRVLFQLKGHFNVRNKADTRIVFPKGSIAKAIILKEELPTLSEDVIDSLLKSICAELSERFSKLESLGNVWIDPDLQYCPIPMQQRNASTALFNVSRGTRLPMTDKETLRFFIYWVGQDVDLSATFYDENFKKISHISYTNLKCNVTGACHSGDITRAPKGAAEFIDVNVGTAAEHARYIMMNVLVYGGPTFQEHDVCYAGWMTRDKPNINDIFDPKTVEQKIDLRSPTRNAVPVIFDLHERKGIWCDLVYNSSFSYGGNNVESNKAAIGDVLKSIMSLDNKSTLYDLFHIHALSRGKIVAAPEQADTIFSINKGLATPFDINKINSDFLV